MFLRDDDGTFDAPVEAVWRFLGDGPRHSEAHRHTEVVRELQSDHEGTYSWVQPFDGHPTRFTMHWRSFAPLGIVYEVRVGPFEGSRFFLYYAPVGERTRVAIVGEFESPSLAGAELEDAVRRFFALEFEQDRAAIESGTRGR